MNYKFGIIKLITIFVLLNNQSKNRYMYYQLKDYDTSEDLGLIRVTNIGEVPNFEEEVKESWNEFHLLEEHELDNSDVDEFVIWHNANRVTQIERIFVTEL